jgi:broad specificity phosphatase PhoE
MEKEVILIRHAELAPSWRKICYGQMDIPLGEEGSRASETVAALIARGVAPSVIYHSGLKRTRHLAERIRAHAPGVVPVIRDDRLRERDYGQWAGRTWEDVFASDPEHFHDLITRPDHYRPPGGETTTEMQDRIRNWFGVLTAEGWGGPVVAVSHCGPIAALCGALLGLPATEWSPWMIGCLESIHIRSGHVVRHGSWLVNRKSL